MIKESNLNFKSETLAQLIINTAEQYKKSDRGQKSLLETLVGAGIWYLPSTGLKLFNQKISKVALQSLKDNSEGTNLVEEHGIPRKVAGRLLYTKHLEEIKKNPLIVKELYLNQFGKFNLVLKQENGNLVKHQKVDVFENEEAAYQKAKIELVYFSDEDYQVFKRKKRKKKPRLIN